ncbi:MAG: 4-hydroxythreonine-4-phosphate dehydrogenase PdxA [Proteobacteria bacterium]|jgi:4-hydroxythreonine-4-phosphate dehydrogenase|nr:4-hydroxythreonine-4-phosphate dehydrogenase PdxA [Pseudomonadota bacterium]
MIAITPGEPGGIGPDLVIQAAQQDRSQGWVVVADAKMLEERAQLLDLPLSINEYLESPSTQAGVLTVLNTPLAESVRAGELCVNNAKGTLHALDRAITGCLEGRFAALVTGPMQKSVIMDAGFAFSGHTEHLAERSGVDDVVMMLATGAMRVSLATTHLPLHAVPGALTQTLLERRLRILHHAMQRQFGLATPRLLVCGLNPHAGESGHMGREEIDVITPVCEKLCAEGLLIRGPLPADTLFTPQYLNDADAVMAMFHDQGLPVLKYSGFGSAVNITLGLPFIRTSVDHGTALDLAGTGQANLGSFLAALSAANTMTERTRATA